MQIHEITLRSPVNEGIMDTLKGAGQKAASAFSNAGATVTNMGLGSNAAFATAQGNKQLQAATKDFAKRTAAEWAKQGAQLTAADAIKLKTQPATQKTAQAPGVKMPKVQAKPGQMSTGVAGSKPGQQMQKMFGQPKGGIQGMKSDLEEAPQEYTTPGGIVVPADTKTDQAAGTATPQAATAVNPRAKATVGKRGNPLTSAYITKFKEWVNQKLTTRETNTGETITLTTVLDRLPDLGRPINQSLTTVYNTRNDPTQNQAAVENFLMTAATGFQQTAALIRKENPDAVAKAATSTAKKRISADPQTERVVQAMGMADSGLDTLADIVKTRGERVTNKTGSNTIDRLLTAAGLI